MTPTLAMVVMRDANRQLGFTAKQTLDYAQSLYEKKLVTYPRTDSRYLTDDMAGMVPQLTADIQKKLKIHPDVPISVNAAQVINSKKVSDYHAIIPTKTSVNSDLSALPSGERAVFGLIARRLICAVSLPYKYTETSVCGAPFIPKSNRSKYCAQCGQKMKRIKAAERNGSPSLSCHPAGA